MPRFEEVLYLFFFHGYRRVGAVGSPTLLGGMFPLFSSLSLPRLFVIVNHKNTFYGRLKNLTEQDQIVEARHGSAALPFLYHLYRLQLHTLPQRLNADLMHLPQFANPPSRRLHIQNRITHSGLLSMNDHGSSESSPQ